MNVYFVRHGESEGNRLEINQPGDSPLSEIGKDQARFIAHRFKTIAIEALISSDYTRALQTAEKISVITGQKVEQSSLFRERKRPTEIEGKHYHDPEAMKIQKEMKRHSNDPKWHYSDEENFFDLKERAIRAVTFLEKRDEKRLAVVTHGTFLRMLVGRMLFGRRFRASDYYQLRRFLVTKNTGLTVCVRHARGWRMETWNDHAHLG